VRRFSRITLNSISIFSILLTKYIFDISNRWVHPMKIYRILAYLSTILAVFCSQVRSFSRITLISLSISFILATKYRCHVPNRWVYPMERNGILAHLCRRLAGFFISGV
jgi:hypothetical protein